ncbi:glycosyltransferase family 2 protein, partial [Podospora australis]
MRRRSPEIPDNIRDSVAFGLYPRRILPRLFWNTIFWTIVLWAVRESYFIIDGWDEWTGYFYLLFLWRYTRFLINCIGYVLYRPARVSNPTAAATYTPHDSVSVILPTVEPLGPDFLRCLTSCCNNNPAVVHIVTTIQHWDDLVDEVTKVRPNYPDVRIDLRVSEIASKRAQVAVAVPMVNTDIIVMLDDHVFWPRNFLFEVLAPFEDQGVGMVGTRKAVERRETVPDIAYRIANFLGAVYLYRHNFEVRATNTIDGGQFVISSRTCAIRTPIMKSVEFLAEYQAEYFFFNIYGPLNPDDDNYNTRFVVRKGWKIKWQDTAAATITTTIGVQEPVWGKFLGQLQRWVRTTWRSNTTSLLRDPAVWAYQPYCIYAVYLTSYTNFAILTDPLLIWLFAHSKLYTTHLLGNFSNEPIPAFLPWGKVYTSIWPLLFWILFTKLVKIREYFARHPQDWWCIFPYLAFAYIHSFIKAYAGFTFYDHGWTGR